MKFKVDEKYWPDIQNYLTTHEITYSYEVDQQTNVVIFGIRSPEAGINIEHEIAQKLLSEYNKEKINNEKLTLLDWVEGYEKIFQPLGQEEIESGYLNYMLMLHEFNEIKKRIVMKKEKLKRLIAENSLITQKYSNQTKIEQQRLRLSLQNIEYRLRMKSGGQEQNQQLERINNLLKNGLWGLLPQIQDKIQKINTLNREIEQLKTNPN